VCNYGCAVPSSVHPLVDSRGQAAVNGTVIATTTVVVVRRGTYNLVVTFIGEARDGVEVIAPDAQPKAAAHQGTASATVTGVVDSLTIRPVPTP
jgi:hypothetical protein